MRSATDPSLKQAQVFPVVVLPNATDQNSSFHSDLVKVDPDNILSTHIHSRFQFALQEYDDMFNPQIAKYNGAFGFFEATINMGPTQPPQRKGKVPQYSRDKLVELQQRFDALESQGVFQRP